MPLTGLGSGSGAVLAFTEAFSATAAAAADNVWGDWDLSAIVPVGCACVFVHVRNTSLTTAYDVGVRTNGSALARIVSLVPCGVIEFPVLPDANRVIEIYASLKTMVTFRVIGWLS